MISPSLDPTGRSLLHRSDPLSKVVWGIIFTFVASVAENFSLQLSLVIATIILYYTLTLQKNTPSPPVLRFAISVALLLLLLNLAFAESPLGGFGNVGTTQGSRDLSLAIVKSLRVITTMITLFVITLSTVPRDIARRFESIGLPVRLTEPLAITLRFLPVFEINSRMILRQMTLKYPRFHGESIARHYATRLVAVITALLIAALSQANTTGTSLKLRGFTATRQRGRYLSSFSLEGSGLLYALSAISLAAWLWR